MSGLFPRTDVMSAVGFQDQTFSLLERQELSRTASGVTRAKSFGPPIWLMSATSTVLPNDEAVDFEAVLNSLEGAVHEFYAGDLRRMYPRMHPAGDFSDADAVIAEIGENNKTLSLSGLPAGLALSRGDYLAYDVNGRRWLHQVMAAVTADDEGDTTLFEVRPHLALGIEGANVILKEPAAVFAIEPGSISSTRQGPLHSIVSFRGIQRL